MTNQNLSLSVKTKNNNKVTTFYSDYAKPFVKKYKFIKGFEEGKIDFLSTKKNKISSSKLKIYDFKLKELPALTKLLTLASLQGIADILSGEGVRFYEFEHKAKQITEKKFHIFFAASRRKRHKRSKKKNSPLRGDFSVLAIHDSIHKLRK